MPRQTLRAVLIGAALLMPVAALTLTQTRPPPVLCRAQASATHAGTPGVHHVTLSTRPDCPPGGYARVRMESGRVYPWRVIRPGQPTTFRGVPCWWTARWEAASGRTYIIPTPGLTCPWGRP